MLLSFKKTPRTLADGDAHLKKLVRDVLASMADEDLNDAYPDWRDIVGAPTDGRPYIDTSVPFRRWLSTKETSYQRSINHTDSANIIRRAIERFLAESSI